MRNVSKFSFGLREDIIEVPLLCITSDYHKMYSLPESSFRNKILLKSFYTVIVHLRLEASLSGTLSVACDLSI